MTGAIRLIWIGEANILQFKRSGLRDLGWLIDDASFVVTIESIECVLNRAEVAVVTIERPRQLPQATTGITKVSDEQDDVTDLNDVVGIESDNHGESDDVDDSGTLTLDEVGEEVLLPTSAPVIDDLFLLVSETGFFTSRGTKDTNAQMVADDVDDLAGCFARLVALFSDEATEFFATMNVVGKETRRARR